MPKHKTRRKAVRRTTPARRRMAVAIMAAGLGTRMKSRHPKVLHSIGGKPLVAHVVVAASQLAAPEDIFCIVGHEAERVREVLAESGVRFVLQPEQRGTGDAIRQAQRELAAYNHVLVLSGDVPLMRPETMQRLRTFHQQQRAAMTVLTTEPDEPAQYGRIIRKSRNGKPSAEIERIVEFKALRAAERSAREINSGIYFFRVKPLLENLRRLRTNNPAGEYYLTDMAAILQARGEKVVALKAGDPAEALGVNSRAELAELDAMLRGRKCRELMAAGVTIYRPETVVIDADVEVAADTVIEPFAQLLGRTRIGGECRIASYAIIANSEIGAGAEVRPGCVITQSRVGENARLGPYAHLRPGSDIGAGAHVGNFVETKQTTLGRGSKANHLTYLGDAVIGERVNVGAGTITCNYDGAQKHTTIIEDGAFIGSDATLVAPVRVGRGAYVGAASCITEDVPPESLALGRARQVVKPGWAAAKARQK